MRWPYSTKVRNRSHQSSHFLDTEIIVSCVVSSMSSGGGSDDSQNWPTKPSKALSSRSSTAPVSVAQTATSSSSSTGGGDATNRGTVYGRPMTIYGQVRKKMILTFLLKL